MSILKIYHQCGKIDIEMTPRTVFRKISHGEKGIRIDALALADLAYRTVAEAKRYAESADKHKQRRVVTYKFAERICSFKGIVSHLDTDFSFNSQNYKKRTTAVNTLK